MSKHRDGLGSSVFRVVRGRNLYFKKRDPCSWVCGWKGKQCKGRVLWSQIEVVSGHGREAANNVSCWDLGSK